MLKLVAFASHQRGFTHTLVEVQAQDTLRSPLLVYPLVPCGGPEEVNPYKRVYNQTGSG